MSNFWKFMGGLLVGAVAMKVANDYYKEKTVSKKETEPSMPQTPKPTSRTNNNSIQEIENLIQEFETKKNKTQKDRDVLDLLRVKLNQLKKQ
jgi:hypothetical protein